MNYTDIEMGYLPRTEKGQHYEYLTDIEQGDCESIKDGLGASAKDSFILLKGKRRRKRNMVTDVESCELIKPSMLSRLLVYCARVLRS